MSEYNDEQFDVGVPTSNDVMSLIEHHGIDDDGLTWLDWYKRIQSGDAFHNIMMILVRNRKDPKYAELVDELEAEIEGWL